ncbi:MFS transporter [Kitasatospora sp. NPDC057965]|uniref:MFS transporter n=1 Tax=Kitasatospora sp. NPDC057965 TaxID=3346291 RepID=UPI0036DF9A68
MTLLDEAPETAKTGGGAPAGRRALIAGALLALFLAAADSTVVGSLLPTMARTLGHEELYPWLVSGFLLCSVLATAVAGAAADRFGSKATMSVALLLFAAGSAGVAAAPDMPLLIAARALQGLGAGAVVTLSYVLVGQLFDAAGRARMQGLLSGVWGLAAVVGPALGSAAQATVGWRWVFALNLPIALGTALVVARLAPGASRGTRARARLNVPILVTFSAGLTALLTLLVSPALPALVLAGVVLIGAAALQIAQVRRNPAASLVPVAFVRRREIRAAAVVSIGASVVLYASVTQLPLALTRSGATGETASGLVVMVGALGWVGGAAVCGGLISRFGARTVATSGAVLLALGPLLFITTTHPSLPLAVVTQLCVGLGTGFTTATCLVQVQNTAPAEQLGSYTGAVTLCRNVGAAVGVNLIATIQLNAAEHLGGAEAQSASYRLAFGVLAAAGALTLLASRQLRADPARAAAPAPQH